VLLQAADQRFEQGGLGVVGNLHLDLVESHGDLASVEDGDLIVDHLRDRLSSPVAQRCLSSDRPEPDLRLEGGCPDERAHEIDRLVGRPARIPVEHELLPDEQLPVARVRQLYGPAVARSIPQADAPAGQAKVVGVEIGRRDPLSSSRLDVNSFRNSVEGRESKRQRGFELDLALGHE
jgi:hypothetical protein